MSATVMPLQTQFETPVFTIHDDNEETASSSSSPLFSKKLVMPASTATITPLHTSPSTTQFSQHSFSSASSSSTPIITPSSVHPIPVVAAETDIDEDIDTPNINIDNDRDALDDDFDGGVERKRSDSRTPQQLHAQQEEQEQDQMKVKARRPRKSSSSSNHRTVAILDWDDTLLPSSWLRKQGHLQSFAYALHQYQQQLQQHQNQQQQQQQTDKSTSSSSTSSSTPSPSLPVLPTLPPVISSQLTSLSSAVVSLVRNLMDKNANSADSNKQSQSDDDEDEEDEDEDSVSRVVIVTNAEQGWVELTARSFLPDLLPYLDIPSTTNSATSTTIAPPSTPSPSSSSSASASSSSRRTKTQKKITIISARSSFEQQFPGAPLTWKMRAFEKVLGEAINAFNAETSQLSEQGVLSSSTSRVLNVMSIGDSIIEREAARRVVACTSSTHSVVLCKSVKLAERTSCEKLCRQLQLMTHALNYVRSHGESLDLQMTITDDTEGKLPPTASMQKADLPSPSTTSTDVTASSTSTPTPTSTTPSKAPQHKEIVEVAPPKKAKWWRRVLACGGPVYD